MGGRGMKHRKAYPVPARDHRPPRTPARLSPQGRMPERGAAAAR